MQYLIYFLIITVTTRCCDAEGKLFVKLSYFTNPEGKGANGHICEGKNAFRFLTTNECDHFFEICLKTRGSSYCNLGIKETPAIKNKRTINFGDMIGDMENPLKFAFIQDKFQMDIKVSDDDSTTSSDRVGAFKKYISYLPVGTNGRKPTPRHIKLKSGSSSNILKLEFYLWAVCDRTYYGHDCSVKCIPQNSTTLGRYSCNQTTGEKVCLKPYTGPKCSTINFCASNPCKNNAKCINMANGLACSCPSGFSGRSCEHVEHPCARRRCKNSGTCIVEDKRPKCVCRPGFVGQHCEADYDECYHEKPCQHNGTCINTVGSFKCICKPGFSGIRCDNTPTDMPESSKASPEESFASKSRNARNIQVGEKTDWAYFVAGGAALVAIVCIALLITMYRRRRVLLIKERNAQALVYRAAVQRPCAEENVYIGDNDSEGTLYEDIDRQLQDAESSEIDSCCEEPGSDFANPSYGVSARVEKCDGDKEMKK